MIPDNVRAVLQRRLSRLSEATTQLLTIGSVMGREFDFRIAAAIVRPARDTDLLPALDEALERLIIEPMPAGGESWYRFRHALVRDGCTERLAEPPCTWTRGRRVMGAGRGDVSRSLCDVAYPRHGANPGGHARVVKYSRWRASGRSDA